MRSRSSSILISSQVYAVILMAACNETPASPSQIEPGIVMASISGHFQAEYQGEGSFFAPPRTPGFQLWSRSTTDTGPCPPNGCNQLGLYRVEGGIPRKGAHALVPPADGTPTAFSATFHRYLPESSISESYASLSGEVVITESQADHVKGSFSFEAYQYCRAAAVEIPGVVCQSPLQFDPEAPRITVGGTFEAFRAPDVAIPTQ